MSESECKSAFCPNCTKNVPHYREVKGAISGTINNYIGAALEAMRIGPWYCLHCERRNLLLPSLNPDAQDYRIVDPLAPIQPGAVNIWSQAQCSGHHGNAAYESLENLENKSTASQWNGNFEEVDNGPLSTENILSEGRGVLAGIDGMQDDKCGGSDGELPVVDAYPVETPISASPERRMYSTRMHRVSVKYRDSVVDKILAGKVALSELARTDEYSEAELTSWVADRFKRMQQQLEELNYLGHGRINERAPASGGYGPFGAR